jgi:hypothetical protein
MIDRKKYLRVPTISSINTYNRQWARVSLLYRIEQLEREHAKAVIPKTTFVLRRRSDYFYIQEPPGSSSVFLPDSLYRELWDAFAILLILYQFFAIGYLLSFTSPLSEYEFYLLYFCDLFFIIEVFINFNTGYFSDGTLVKYRKAIAARYIKTTFFFNIIACFPIQSCIKSMKFDTTETVFLGESEYLKLLWLLKLVNFVKLPEIFHNFQCHFTSELIYTMFHLVKFLVSAVIMIHLTTCLMYSFFLKDLEHDGMLWVYMYDSNRNPYLVYFYMTVFTMTSTGYGDVTPYTLSQKILTICIMCLSCWLFAFILTNSKDIMLRYSAKETYFRSVLSRMKKYMQKRKVVRGVRVRIISFLHYLKAQSKNSGIEEKEILADLSAPLREEIFVVTRGKLISKCPIFQGYSLDFLRILIRMLAPSVFAPQDGIIKEGDVTCSIYFIVHGRIEIFHESTQTVFKELNKNKYFGEIAFFLKKVRTASARSLIFSEVLSISRFDFDLLLRQRPKDAEYHKLFETQAYQSLGFLEIRCYLCSAKGHIAKDCKQFVITYDRQAFVKESDNKRYNYNKRVKAPNIEIFHSPLLLERFGNSPKKIPGLESPSYRPSLEYKCKDYVKEENRRHYRTKINQVKADNESVSDNDEEESRRSSILPMQNQYTSQFLRRRSSLNSENHLTPVLTMHQWEDNQDSYSVTFGQDPDFFTSVHN